MSLSRWRHERTVCRNWLFSTVCSGIKLRLLGLMAPLSPEPSHQPIFKFSSVSLCLCVLGGGLWMCMCTHLCMHMWTPEVSVRYLPPSFSSCLFQTWPCAEPELLVRYTDWLEPRRLCVCLPSSAVTALCRHTWLFCMAAGDLRSSCLHSNQLTFRAISPAQQAHISK